MNHVIILTGATASGKTSLIFDVCEHCDIEIVSVDSAQVYCKFDIGTAKPTLLQRNQIPHHLIDICDLNDGYNVANFVKDVSTVIAKIHSRGRLPILVGGTLMYINVLLNGLSILPAANYNVREILYKRLEQYGSDSLYMELLKIDQQSALNIHPNDINRIIRAIEVYHISGKSLSELSKNKVYPLKNLTITPLVLSCDKQQLHLRISKRLQSMFDNGFIEEVEELSKYYTKEQLHTIIGYGQVYEYLNGQLSFSNMKELILNKTNQFAKHQVTWLKKLFFIELSAIQSTTQFYNYITKYL